MNSSQTQSRKDLHSGGVRSAGARYCFHCGDRCPTRKIALAEKQFCCHGCKTVFELLSDSGLNQYYDLERCPGAQPAEDSAGQARFDFLDEEAVRKCLLDFTDGTQSRVTLHIPAVHCIACVWLLENLYRLQPGVGRSLVNFPRKEVTISFEDAKVKLSQVVGLLSSLGYEPTLRLTDLEEVLPDKGRRSLLLKLGVAGFCFGNIMLFSLPSYLGLEQTMGARSGFSYFFNYLNLILALPVLFYSARDYWRAAWTCLSRKLVTIDLPISLGIAALFSQSLFEIITARGPGYFDSFAGLIFLLLIGKFFQQKSFDALSFDRDYKSYFPLSVIRVQNEQEETIPITRLEVGDQISVRNQELIPADAHLASGPAMIDYSFVTGESEPVAKAPGDYIYAGGRQMGGAIELTTIKKVSQSYLTSLWNNAVFEQKNKDGINSLTNRFSRHFTLAVLAIASLSGLFWLFVDPAIAVKAFSSVLIVACPCALALSAPFTLGAALRVLGRNHLYLRDASVIETMADLDEIYFDKTGTLTHGAGQGIRFLGVALTPQEQCQIRELSRHSTHPLCTRLYNEHVVIQGAAGPFEGFAEAPGLGVVARFDEQNVLLGSQKWLQENGIELIESASEGSMVHLAINGVFRGSFVFGNVYRPEIDRMIDRLNGDYRLSVVSGDNELEKPRLQRMFGFRSRLLFKQSPHDKLEAIKQSQLAGKRVVMVGDGLNDAGALHQSDVGIAVTEDISSFSPACDAILDAGHFHKLEAVLRFSKVAMKIIWVSFAISILYNVIGLSFAARGALSPLIAAVLMPLSSVTVIAFALSASEWMAKRVGLE